MDDDTTLGCPGAALFERRLTHFLTGVYNQALDISILKEVAKGNF